MNVFNFSILFSIENGCPHYKRPFEIALKDIPSPKHR